MARMMWAATLIAIVVLPTCLAWSHEGHIYVCSLAQGMLSDRTSAVVKALLPPWAEGYMPGICSWADLVARTSAWRWSLPLHYIDTSALPCGYIADRDCAHGGMPGVCAAGAILNYTSQLQEMATQAMVEDSAVLPAVRRNLGRNDVSPLLPLSSTEAAAADSFLPALGLGLAQGPKGAGSALVKSIWAALTGGSAAESVSPAERRVAAQAAELAHWVQRGTAAFDTTVVVAEAAEEDGEGAEAAAVEMMQAAGMGSALDADPSVRSPTTALMLLTHLMADIHQPLHVAFASDHGGHAVNAKWFNQATNLHTVWDKELLRYGVWRHHDNSPVEFVQSLARRLSSDWAAFVPIWAGCSGGPSCPHTYAEESAAEACQWAYRGVVPGSSLSEDYAESRFPLVEMEVAKAAVRLASALNRIFDPPAPATSAQ